MIRGDSQQKDKKIYRLWCFCNIEIVNKDICQLRYCVYCELSIYWLFLGKMFGGKYRVKRKCYEICFSDFCFL